MGCKPDLPAEAADPMARQKQALFEALGADPEAWQKVGGGLQLQMLACEVLQGFWHEVRPLPAQHLDMI